MSGLFRIGIVAPAAVVPPVELTLGVERLKAAGFAAQVHPQCARRHLFYAGSDEERARAFFDCAHDPSLSAIWCARGGYGTTRILPLLEKMAAARGIPDGKLLLGYSDATSLLEFTRSRWGWCALHAPMPGSSEFSLLPSHAWQAITRLAQGRAVAKPWKDRRLRFFYRRPSRPIRGQLVGGNLSVWTSLMGTPYAPDASGKLLFFEEVNETLPRVDRMVQQVAAAGGFERTKAVVLGEFTNCEDQAPRVLKAVPVPKSRRRALVAPAARDMGPLRPWISQRRALGEIFGEIGERYRIPVAYGLPVGHGPGHGPLPLGADYRLGVEGRLELLGWDWLGSTR